MASTEPSEKCPICLDILDTNINVATTVCGHTFHTNCLLQASNQTPNCPLCRKMLFEVETVDDDSDNDEITDDDTSGDEIIDDDTGGDEIIDDENNENNRNNEINNSLNVLTNNSYGILLRNVLGEFMTTFPNNVIMSEIHQIYQNTIPAEYREVTNMSEETIAEMAVELNSRVSGYLLFVSQQMRSMGIEGHSFRS